MTDEMKLLMALCNALGFEVETTVEDGKMMHDPTGAFCGYEGIVDYKLTQGGYSPADYWEVAQPEQKIDDQSDNT